MSEEDAINKIDKNDFFKFQLALSAVIEHGANKNLYYDQQLFPSFDNSAINNHMVGTFLFNGDDNHNITEGAGLIDAKKESIAYQNINQKISMRARNNGAIVILFYSENTGNVWAKTFCFHKGSTFEEDIDLDFEMPDDWWN